MGTASEESTAATRRFIENVWNEGRYDLGMEHLAPDFVNHTPFGDETREQFLDRIRAFRTAFPDLHMTVEEMLDDGYRVITRFSVRGSHRAPFRGIPATNRTISITGIAVDRVVDGKRVEAWAVLDLFGLMQQLGGVLQSGQAATQRSPVEDSVGVIQHDMADPRAVAERWTRAVRAHDLEAVVSCFAADYRDEAPARRGESVVGRDQVRTNFAALFQDIPDLRADPLHAVTAGDTVWLEWCMSGTRRDGTPMEFVGVNIFGVRDQQFVWGRIYTELVRDAGGIEAQIERMTQGT